MKELVEVLLTIVLLLLGDEDVDSSLDRVGAVTEGASALVDILSRNESSLFASGLDLFPD